MNNCFWRTHQGWQRCKEIPGSGAQEGSPALSLSFGCWGRSVDSAGQSESSEKETGPGSRAEGRNMGLQKVGSD